MFMDLAAEVYLSVGELSYNNTSALDLLSSRYYMTTLAIGSRSLK